MSAFKDAVSKDIKSVFINLDEFADEHYLNGQLVRCVVDEDLTTSAPDNLVGVFLNAITIYIAKEDLEVQPVEGALLYLDEKMYLVKKVSDEAGVLVIVAEVYRQ